jgi:hypothetical protein
MRMDTPLVGVRNAATFIVGEMKAFLPEPLVAEQEITVLIARNQKTWEFSAILLNMSDILKMTTMSNYTILSIPLIRVSVRELDKYAILILPLSESPSGTLLGEKTNKGTDRMKRIGIILYLLTSLLLMSRCGNNSSSSMTNYEIVNEEKTETSTKAQLIEYVVYKDTIYTEDLLKKVLLDVYDKNKDKNLFTNHNSPTVFGIYLFTSKEIAEKDKSAWVAMLMKGPRDPEPRLSYNDLKIKSLQGLNDNIKSEDEVAYEELTKYLEERNLELCSFYTQLGDMELDCIHKADAKYPDYGIKHNEYSNKLMEEEREKLAKKYNLADSIFINVSVFAMSYCK